MVDSVTSAPASDPSGIGAGTNPAVSSRAILQGGVTLGLRQLAGYGLRLIGLFLITRVLGPEGYAPYVASSVLIDSALAVVADGMNAHLVLGGAATA